MLGNIYLSEINDRDSFSKYLQILPTYNIDKIVTLFNRNFGCIQGWREPGLGLA